MRFPRAFLVVTATVLWMAAAAAQAQDKPDPRSKLETAIPDAIRLLEAEEYVNLLKQYVAPDDLKKITEKASLEEFAVRFGEGKAEKLLAVLKAIKDSQPELNAEGTLATFTFPEELQVGSRNKIEFAKVNNLWYIKN